MWIRLLKKGPPPPSHRQSDQRIRRRETKSPCSIGRPCQMKRTDRKGWCPVFPTYKISPSHAAIPHQILWLNETHGFGNLLSDILWSSTCQRHHSEPWPPSRSVGQNNSFHTSVKGSSGAPSWKRRNEEWGLNVASCCEGWLCDVFGRTQMIEME